MSEVKRYVWAGVHGLAEQQNGNWVSYIQYATLQQKLDAAEAKLAELERQERQEPVAQVTTWWPLGIDGGEQKMLQPLGNLPAAGTKLFTRPAPAINLADLVPPEKNPAFIAYVHLDETTADKPEAYAKGFNACRAAILRNIEEKSK